MSTLPPSRWFRWLKKWKLFVVTLLIVLLSQSAVSVFAQQASTTSTQDIVNNQATATYELSGDSVDLISNQIQIELGESGGLIDPLGTLLGCDGQPLDSYAGFEMGLYEPDASGIEIGDLVVLTTTTGTDSIPPNVSNVNPFSLEIGNGQYNFLLDSSRTLTGPLNIGKTQTDTDAQYILVITPPSGSNFTERRVRLTILGVTTNALNNTSTLSYRATSLDGQPIGSDGQTELLRTVDIDDAAVQNLVFFEIGLNTTLCENNQIRITKAADRSAAQPGDIVVYRLLIQSSTTADINSVIAIDALPLGFQLIPESVAGLLDGNAVAVTTQQSGSTINFSVAETLTDSQSLEIIYATRIIPDAIRGSGRNSATVSARRIDNGFEIQDGPSISRIVLDPGILSDCGTLIGRVFEDKNFDGEQQVGEAGIPNAVIFLDDGNRVVTDADGLFSLQKVLPGQRTGTLDLSSLPGYTLAPNLYFSERNSRSRLVNLAPGGLARMNFGVTPTFQEEQG
ncbi:MAG: hypothetical protein AAF703_00875 [Cyanobacteria bacterium P01_D01_bin.105]